eukprot:g32341.t1
MELPTYVRDTTHTLDLFQKFQIPGPQQLIFTMDVQSLPNQSPSTDTLIRLVELVLSHNKCSFDSSHFLQTKGVVMDTHMGLSYSHFFAGFMEQSLFNNYPGTIPHLFLCYVDDCIGATLCSREELKQFVHFTNTFHPALKFTWTISDTSFPFMDLAVSISSNQLSTNINLKLTDSHNYLDYTSSHPLS